MPKFEYSPNITLGAILQIITVLGACLGAYTALASHDVQHDERILNNAAEVARLEKRIEYESQAKNTQMEELNKTLRALDDKITRYIIRDLESQINERDAKSKSR